MLAVLGWVNLNLGALLYATRDVDNVGLTRAAVAVVIAAALLGFVYWKIHSSLRLRKVFFGVLAAGLCVAVPVMFWKLTHMWGGLTPEQLVDSLQPNGDSIYTYSAGYICRNLPGHHQAAPALCQCGGGFLAAGTAGHCPGRTYRLSHCGSAGCSGIGLVLCCGSSTARQEIPLPSPAVCARAAG